MAGDTQSTRTHLDEVGERKVHEPVQPRQLQHGVCLDEVVACVERGGEALLVPVLDEVPAPGNAGGGVSGVSGGQGFKRLRFGPRGPTVLSE